MRMATKVRLNLTADPDRVAQARAAGVNLSALLDHALVAEMHRIESLRDLADELAEIDADRAPSERERAKAEAALWVSDTFGAALAEFEGHQRGASSAAQNQNPIEPGIVERVLPTATKIVPARAMQRRAAGKARG